MDCVDTESFLREALTLPGLTEDSRGLLLDAALHYTLVRALHEACFRGAVATCTDETYILEHIFHKIAKSGT